MAEEWEPANAVERALATARARDDLHLFLEVTARAVFYVPTAGADPNGAQRFVLWQHGGDKHLVAFTSLTGLVSVLGESAAENAIITSYPELRTRWPDPSWLFALNPNLPINSTFPIEQLAELLDPAARVTTLGEAVSATESVADDAEVEERLVEALLSGNTERILGALAAAQVYLPVSEALAAGQEPDLDTVAWWTRPDKTGTILIPAFTSARRAADELPAGTPVIRVPLVRLSRAWPDTVDKLVIDPGSKYPVSLPAEAVAGVAVWLDENESTTRTGSAVLTGALGRQPAKTDSAAPATPPVLVVKLLPPGTVDRYLNDGYDRVSGFVYPYGALDDATSPAELYRMLGMTAETTPFAPSDQHVFLLRWYAHVPSLYPLAYGGRSEEMLTMFGGWIIEAEPFVGAGVAPGTVAVPELKVDGIVLPHGAQISRLDATGGETVLATYDADFRWWVPERTTNVAQAMRLP